MTSRFMAIRAAILLAAIAAAGGPVAADELCGTTIVSDFRLDYDLVCVGNGLIVGASGIKLNLDGHSITGSGTGVGITVIGRSDVSIKGGTVRNFVTGVLIVNSSGVVVHNNELADHVDGVDLQAGSIGNTIKDNHFQGNRTRGIMMRGDTSANVVKANTFSGNRVGILLFGPVGAIVKDNEVSSSTLAAIRINVLATGNLVLDNTITSNPAGIDFIIAPTGSATGNTLRANTLALNACALKGPLDGNTLVDNVFESNSAESCL